MNEPQVLFIQKRSARLSRAETALIRESIPPDLRNQVASIVWELHDSDASANKTRFESMFGWVWRSLGRSPGALGLRRFQQRDLLQGIVTEYSDVSEFLDLIELTAKACQQVRWHTGYALVTRAANEAFLITRFGYRFVDDELVETGSDLENRAVDEARSVLLSDPRFGDAEAKFVSALVKATSTREADYPDAVHAAVSAIEEVCRELMGDEKITLDRALDQLRRNRNANPNIVELMKKLYHARGDLAGAAHGAGTTSAHVARFVIHGAAASIVFLVQEFGTTEASSRT